MTQQKLTGAALLAEVNQNPKMSAEDLAVRCGYTKTTRSRSGEERIKPLPEEYYKALLLAQGVPFGLILPESQKNSRNAVISYKVLKTGAGVVPRRFMDSVGCEPNDYFFVEEGEDGTLVIKKDVEKSESERARIEAAVSAALDEPSESFVAENEDEEEAQEEADEDEDADEEVDVQQPALPSGVPSTTVRVPQHSTVS